MLSRQQLRYQLRRAQKEANYSEKHMFMFRRSGSLYSKGKNKSRRMVKNGYLTALAHDLHQLKQAERRAIREAQRSTDDE